MIVKKMPIFQGFPDFETVKLLSKKCLPERDFQPVFYDIETTGLSRNSTFLYLIGAVIYENNSWQLCQWMAESSKEEPTVLNAFAQVLRNCSCIISYNGDRFDKPYLEARYAHYGLPSPFEGITSLDLYLHLKPLKKLLKLAQMKQPSMEEFLGIHDRIYSDGKECISLYKSFLKTRDTCTADTVMGHNLEDVLGLGQIHRMLGYLCLYHGDYEVTQAVLDDCHLIMTLSLPCSLPAAFSNGNGDFYITGQEQEVRLIIKSADGRLRQYYSNYKDYDYLPKEDTAIPKVLSACMDKKLRRSATKDTCYTWFVCSDAFLSNPALQKQYLSHTLPYLLDTLR